MTKNKTIIIGAGFTGLSAAYDLAKAGWDVTILEKDNSAGGLAGTFELSPGHTVEKFYHHWFASDLHILNWLREIGVGSKIKFLPTNTGLFFANSIFRLASPLDLLRFRPLPFIDRVRTGIMALVARRISNWKKLEDISAKDWIIKIGGRRGYEVIWQPLLQGKFGIEADNVSAVWFWNKLKLRGSSRDQQGNETLAYFSGSFGAATQSIVEKLKEIGVKFYFGTEAQSLRISNNQVAGVLTSQGDFDCERVLATLPLPLFLNLVPELPGEYVTKARKIRFLGNVCLVLRLKRSLSSTYWLNIADPNFPYVGIIEHTNFDSADNYGGERIAYLSKYLPVTDRMFTMTDEELFSYSLPYIQKIFPEFSQEWVVGFRAWRAHFSQPVITKHYSQLIPPNETPIRNLWLSTMAQVYPEDRGTNYAVREGRKVAAQMLNKT